MTKDQQTISRLADVSGSLRAEMEMHMHKEELTLSPFLEQYGRAETMGRVLPPVPFGSVANPIAVMEREHDGAGGALLEIRELTNGFEYPSYACSTVRSLFDGLKALEEDLRAHSPGEQHPVSARNSAGETIGAAPYPVDQLS